MAEILVLDDVRDATVLTRKILEKKGHTVHTFIDEDLALAYATEHDLDLAILDIKLRKMDGVEVLSELKKLQPAVKVIMLTGYPTLDTAQDAIRLGASAYCAKPIDKSELERKVAEALSG